MDRCRFCQLCAAVERTRSLSLSITPPLAPLSLPNRCSPVNGTGATLLNRCASKPLIRHTGYAYSCHLPPIDCTRLPAAKELHTLRNFGRSRREIKEGLQLHGTLLEKASGGGGEDGG